MVKSSPEQALPSSSAAASSHSDSGVKYTGVRKRKWGKYVSEIRLPNSRERIWLGSYDTAEKAARAFDAAMFCLRGRGAKFNFPENPPEIANGRSMTPAEIQVAAAQFAHSGSDTRVGSFDSRSDSLSSSEHYTVESPCPSVTCEAGPVEGENIDIPFDSAFLDQFLSMGTASNAHDSGTFPEFDNFWSEQLIPSSHHTDGWPENNNDEHVSSESSFLWNF